MEIIQEHRLGSRIVGTNFQIPNWSYDPSPAQFHPPERAPPSPEEVHPSTPPRDEQEPETKQIFRWSHDGLPAQSSHAEHSNRIQEEQYSCISPKTTKGSHPCTPPNTEQQQIELGSSTTAESLSPKVPPCPQCQGQKFNFAAYFHSTTFPYPPHAFLAQIEKSYLLKDRLLSLLIDYVIHRDDNTETSKKSIEDVIRRWTLEVESLVVQMRVFGTERAEPMLEEVMRWTNGMARSIWQHVCGVVCFNGLVGSRLRLKRMKLVACEFRKMWEKVWIVLSEGYVVKGPKSCEDGDCIIVETV